MTKITGMTKAQKRPYSREFKARGKGKNYLLDSVPLGLWRKVQAKAKVEGLSVRAAILTVLTEWVEKKEL